MLRKCNKVCVLVFFLMITPVGLFSQNTFSKGEIETFIEEVFCEKSSQLVFNNKERLRVINSFFSRITIELRTDIDLQKKYDNYFDLPLINKYCKSFTQRDLTYSNNFNPLKYKVPMFPRKQKIYRLGNSQYLLFINPLN